MIEDKMVKKNHICIKDPRKNKYVYTHTRLSVCVCIDFYRLIYFFPSFLFMWMLFIADISNSLYK